MKNKGRLNILNNNYPILYIQLTEYEVGQFALYEVKPGILRKAFWVFKLELLL